MKAELVHIETGVEWYKDGSLFTPSPEQKILWSLIGLPEGTKRLEEKFETSIDVIKGKTKREITEKLTSNFENGIYSYLPELGINQQVELRWDTYFPRTERF